MYAPLNYSEITWADGHYRPSAVRGKNNWSFKYWMRSLYERIASRFDFELPETWQGNVKNFFYYCLIRAGFVMISRDDGYTKDYEKTGGVGYFFQPCGISGYNFYYQPARAIVSNPMLQREFTIGVDCELLQLTPDYMGMFDVMDRYATQLSTLDVAIHTNIINSKLAYILSGKNKGEAEALKQIIDRINRGEPAVFVDKSLGERKKPTEDAQPFFVTQIQECVKNYIVSQQLQDHQTILNAFDAEIGINTIPYAKAERMVTSEAESRQNDSAARMLCITDCLDSSIKRVKDLYPDIRLSYELRGVE